MRVVLVLLLLCTGFGCDGAEDDASDASSYADGGLRDAGLGRDGGPDGGPDAGAKPGDAGQRDGGVPGENMPWLMLGGNPGRTFSTNASIRGQVRFLWRHTPPEPAFNSLAADDVVYVKWGSGPAVDRLSPDGSLVWRYARGGPDSLRYWISATRDRVIINDNGLSFLRASDGAELADFGGDHFGQSLVAQNVVITVQDETAHGPGLFIGGFTPDGQRLWRQNEYGMDYADSRAVPSAIASEGDLVFYAVQYHGPATDWQAIGLYAFHRSDGALAWFIPMGEPPAAFYRPLGAQTVSAAGGFLYTLEDTDVYRMEH